MEKLIEHYGTHTISLTLRQLLYALRAKGSDIDPAPIESMASDLEIALSQYKK